MTDSTARPQLKLEAEEAPASPRSVQDALYAAEFGYVWNVLRRLGVKSRDLEDLTHDVFVTAFRKLRDFDSSRPVRPWLFGIAFRVASAFRNRAHQQREVAGEVVDAVELAPGADESLAVRQERALVFDALQAVEISRRAVLMLHDMDGHPIPEVAESLSIPLNTAYSRLRLARGELGEAVKRLRLERGVK